MIDSSREERSAADASHVNPPQDLPDGLLNELGKEARGMWDAVCRYLQLQGDLARSHLWHLSIGFAISVLVVLVLAGLFLIAGGYAISGLAGGLGEWLGSSWAGQLAAGCAVFGGLAIGVWVVRMAWQRQRVKALETKYHQEESQS